MCSAIGRCVYSNDLLVHKIIGIEVMTEYVRYQTDQINMPTPFDDILRDKCLDIYGEENAKKNLC